MDLDLQDLVNQIMVELEAMVDLEEVKKMETIKLEAVVVEELVEAKEEEEDQVKNGIKILDKIVEGVKVKIVIQQEVIIILEQVVVEKDMMVHLEWEVEEVVMEVTATQLLFSITNCSHPLLRNPI
jgi:hypothetical protein